MGIVLAYNVVLVPYKRTPNYTIFFTVLVDTLLIGSVLFDIILMDSLIVNIVLLVPYWWPPDSLLPQYIINIALDTVFVYTVLLVPYLMDIVLIWMYY